VKRIPDQQIREESPRVLQRNCFCFFLTCYVMWQGWWCATNWGQQSKIDSSNTSHRSETEESLQVSTINTQYSGQILQWTQENWMIQLPQNHRPPIIMNLSNEDLLKLYNTPFVLKQPFHNQRVERHIKLVTEAAGSVAGFEKRDGMIRQRILSSQIMKNFHTKHQYTVWNSTDHQQRSLPRF